MFNFQFSILTRKEKSSSSNLSDSAILSCIGGTFGNPASTSDENSELGIEHWSDPQPVVKTPRSGVPRRERRMCGKHLLASCMLVLLSLGSLAAAGDARLVAAVKNRDAVTTRAL